MTDAVLRFVVLEHTGMPGRADHVDLLVERTPGDDPDERRCLAWRRDGTDPLDPDMTMLVAAPDHRAFYLDHEGPVPDDRGIVRRLDAGTWNPDHVDDRRVEGEFAGNILTGRVRLAVLPGGSGPAGEPIWVLTRP